MLGQQIFYTPVGDSVSDRCTYLKQKPSNVKVSFFKHEVDKIYAKHKFSSNSYWLQFESISIDIKYPIWGQALTRGETLRHLDTY